LNLDAVEDLFLELCEGGRVKLLVVVDCGVLIVSGVTERVHIHIEEHNIVLFDTHGGVPDRRSLN